MSNLEIGKEHAAPREDAAIAAITESLKRIVTRSRTRSGIATRDAHAKHHGLVLARVVVERNLPIELRQGIFAVPGRSYQAFIRFSNSNPSVYDDWVKNVRGMAIKVLDVDGAPVPEHGGEARTQDFLFVSSEVFFIRNAIDYVDFAKAAVAGTRFAIPSFFFCVKPFRFRWRELWTVWRALTRVRSPLNIPYFSQTPYRFGHSAAVKYKVEPAHDGGRIKWARRAGRSPDYLRETMARQLAAGPAMFDFMVQLQSDPRRMPIEDALVRWRSPYRKVATITILQQVFDSELHQALAENISMTPWHSLEAHRPLGGINRTRKVAYRELSKLRHELNDTGETEATTELWNDICARFSAAAVHLR